MFIGASSSRERRRWINPRRMSSLGTSFTDKQGPYLAFLDAYTRVNGRPPAEADMQRHFRVSPPSVHHMVLTLERAGLIRRQPGLARSIEVLVDPKRLPVLSRTQPVNSSVQWNEGALTTAGRSGRKRHRACRPRCETIVHYERGCGEGREVRRIGPDASVVVVAEPAPARTSRPGSRHPFV